jgi:carboxylesterase type B
MPTVFVAQGGLKGRTVTTTAGTTYCSFQGIPYAKPPVGPLRFQAPQEPDPWSDVRDAVVEGSVAPHIEELLKQYMGEEDCLFLNVYTQALPESTTDRAKPVMVWIHGGGFYMGSGNSNMYGPDYLVSEDVVLVTINYRLGALGFLSTGDAAIPGNNGLKDQVMALRWVQQNIAQFGGDPGNVTIFGESAGGGSVHLLLLSPMSKGLFHRAIAQSGSALNPWSFDDPQTARRKAFRFAETLGCTTTDSYEVLEFLMKVPALRLVEAIELTLTEEEKHPLPLFFAPTKDISQNVEDIFLPDSPTNIILQGKFHKIPFMIGVTSKEGMFVMADAVKHPSWYESLNEKFRVPVPHKFKIDDKSTKYEELAGKIKNFYFGNDSLSEDTWSKLADLYSDSWFVTGIIEAIRMQIAVSMSSAPIYFYHFAFDGKLGLAEVWLGSNRLQGACHADEIGYLFHSSLTPDKHLDPDDDSLKTLRRMVMMWTNFAKSGNPTPRPEPLLGVTWTPVTGSQLSYLNIDKSLSMETNLTKTRMEFWEEMHELYDWFQ